MENMTHLISFRYLFDFWPMIYFYCGNFIRPFAQMHVLKRTAFINLIMRNIRECLVTFYKIKSSVAPVKYALKSEAF